MWDCDTAGDGGEASALICALVLGPRLGFGKEGMPPHNLTYTVMGAAMLWVGWFGFNAGSALGASNQAACAFVATHLSASAAAMAWAAMEWITRGKPSVLGTATGAVAGLVCITPASGFVTPMPAIMSLDDVVRGSLLFKDGEGAPLLEAPQVGTEVEITVSGLVA